MFYFDKYNDLEKKIVLNVAVDIALNAVILIKKDFDNLSNELEKSFNILDESIFRFANMNSLDSRACYFFNNEQVQMCNDIKNLIYEVYDDVGLDFDSDLNFYSTANLKNLLKEIFCGLLEINFSLKNNNEAIIEQAFNPRKMMNLKKFLSKPKVRKSKDNDFFDFFKKESFERALSQERIPPNDDYNLNVTLHCEKMFEFFLKDIKHKNLFVEERQCAIYINKKPVVASGRNISFSNNSFVNKYLNT